MDLRQYLDAAPKRVVRETFGMGRLSFEVELQLCSRGDLEAMRKKATTRVKDGRTGQYRDELKMELLRKYMAEHCITSWSGLTYGKLTALCNRLTPNGDYAGMQDTAIPFENEIGGNIVRDNVLVVLEHARGRVLNADNEEVVTSFEDWVWEKITSLADDDARMEAGEKNA